MLDNLIVEYNKRHAHLRDHYIDYSGDGFYLCFVEDWLRRLPKEGTSDGFRVFLKDTVDNKLYESLMYCAFEKTPAISLNMDYEPVEIFTLLHYFYSEHYCSCHRKSDAKLSGAITDDECGGNRFLIERISPRDSDLILLSEVYSLEELEENLKW